MLQKLGIIPWLDMWIRPQKTIQAIVGFNPNYLIPLLSTTYGFCLLLQAFQNFSLGDRVSSKLILLGGVFGSFFAGFLVINTVSGLLYWTGKWIGGTGSFHYIRAAVAWSNMPNIVNILIWVINTTVFGKVLFTRTFNQIPFVGRELALVFLTSFVQVILAIWIFILMLKSLSQVQRFPIWKAILNVIMALGGIFIGLSILISFLSIMISWMVK